MRSGLRFMILKVPVGSNERLPDAVQVGMTVGHARGPILWKLLTCGRQHERGSRND
jgi:hypothetical protein